MKTHRIELRLMAASAAMLTALVALAVVAIMVSGERPNDERSVILIQSAASQNPDDASELLAKQDEEGGELVPGREVRVTMKDGRTFKGEFVKEDRLNVVIRIVGIETTFDALDVDSVVPIKTFEEQYRALKNAIRKGDADRRFQLAQWLYSRKRYELAAEELESLLDDFSDFAEARDLLRAVNRTIELERSKGGQAEGAESEKTAPAGRTGEQDSAFIKAAILSDDQVNLLRVYEVNLDDPPRMIVSRETIDKMFEEYGDSDLLPKTDFERRRFYAKEPAEILDLLFELQARDLYGDVRVLSEPAAFMKFRLDVHRTWLINACATSECHGGAEAGKLFLFNRRSNDSRIVYTNFLILERTRINNVPLLDYDKPEESLLLQMGLPPGQTATPHPRVDRWRPVFHDRTDPMYQKAVDWLNAMYRPRPEYPVDYRLPRLVEPEDAQGDSSADGAAANPEVISSESSDETGDDGRGQAGEGAIDDEQSADGGG